jgi:hypothetical protein
VPGHSGLFERGFGTDASIINFSKAFDLVPHDYATGGLGRGFEGSHLGKGIPCRSYTKSENRKATGARGGVVVKALRYKPAGRGFGSRWFYWNFSVT